MNTAYPFDQLLQWRLTQAEAAAPPAPRAARLLELARPWWEVWPVRFQQLAERLNAIHVAFGHAMAEPPRAQPEPVVPAIVMRTATEFETSARILYVSVRDGRLRMRFQLDAAGEDAAAAFEVTFVAAATPTPLLSATATGSVNNEYSVEEDLPAELAEAWETLRVTDRMPFRFILRPATSLE